LSRLWRTDRAKETTVRIASYRKAPPAAESPVRGGSEKWIQAESVSRGDRATKQEDSGCFPRTVSNGSCFSRGAQQANTRRCTRAPGLLGNLRNLRRGAVDSPSRSQPQDRCASREALCKLQLAPRPFSRAERDSLSGSLVPRKVRDVPMPLLK